MLNSPAQPEAFLLTVAGMDIGTTPLASLTGEVGLVALLYSNAAARVR